VLNHQSEDVRLKVGAFGKSKKRRQPDGPIAKGRGQRAEKGRAIKSFVFKANSCENSPGSQFIMVRRVDFQQKSL
jgi:hypothetical protein